MSINFTLHRSATVTPLDPRLCLFHLSPLSQWHRFYKFEVPWDFKLRLFREFMNSIACNASEILFFTPSPSPPLARNPKLYTSTHDSRSNLHCLSIIWSFSFTLYTPLARNPKLYTSTRFEFEFTLVVNYLVFFFHFYSVYIKT